MAIPTLQLGKQAERGLSTLSPTYSSKNWGWCGRQAVWLLDSETLRPACKVTLPGTAPIIASHPYPHSVLPRSQPLGFWQVLTMVGIMSQGVLPHKDMWKPGFVERFPDQRMV